MSVAPSPASSGTDWSIDHALTYFFNSLEQTVPFKVTVYPQGESPTKENSEVILVNAYSSSTRTGGVAVAEVQAGHSAPGSVDVVEATVGSASPAVSEVQTVTVDGTAGTYTLSFGGNTTAAINYNDTAATVQTRLRALASIGSTGVTVTGSAGGPYTVTFAGSLANAQQAIITADASLLTTGGAGSVSVVETTHGGVGVNEVQTVTVTASDGTFTLTFGGQTTDSLPWDVTADSLAVELAYLSTIGSGNVQVDGAAGGPYTVTFIGSLGGAAQSLLTADASLLTSGGQAEVQSVAVDADGGTFRLSADGGVNYTAALAFNASAATVQAALRGLAAVGSGNCLVVYDSVSAIYTVTWIAAKTNSSRALLVADASSLTVTTAHVTSCLRGQDGTTARTMVVGDHVEVTKLQDWGFVVETGHSFNDYSFGGAGGTSATVIYFTNSVFTKDLTGLAGGSPGRRVLLVNAPTVGGSFLTVHNENSGSLSSNRIRTIGSSYDPLDGVLQAGEAMELVYDGTEARWVESSRQSIASPSNYGLVRIANLGSGQEEALAADDGSVVHLSGTETVSGDKTFTGTPVLFTSQLGVGASYSLNAGGDGTNSTTSLSSAGSINVVRSVDSFALRCSLVADASYRFAVLTSGIMEWGDGTNPPDVFLKRSAAGVLHVSGALEVADLLTPAATQTDVTTTTVGSGTTLTPDVSVGEAFNVTVDVSGATTLTVAAPTNNPGSTGTQTIVVRVQNTGASGSTTVTWAGGTNGYNFGSYTKPTSVVFGTSVFCVFQWDHISKVWRCISTN